MSRALRSRSAPNSDRINIGGYALAMLILIGVVIGFVQSARFPADRDFISFWGAAQLAIAGNPRRLTTTPRCMRSS